MLLLLVDYTFTKRDILLLRASALVYIPKSTDSLFYTDKTSSTYRQTQCRSSSRNCEN